MRFACLADGPSVSSYVPLATWPFDLPSWSARHPKLASVYTGVIPLLHARLLLVALLFSLSLSVSLSFSRTVRSDFDFQGGRKYYVCFVPSRVMSAVCRILEPFPSVGISTKWSKESDTEEGDIFGCYARTYLCIILINSIRGVWFRLLSY